MGEGKTEVNEEAGGRVCLTGTIWSFGTNLSMSLHTFVNFIMYDIVYTSLTRLILASRWSSDASELREKAEMIVDRQDTTRGARVLA